MNARARFAAIALPAAVAITLTLAAPRFVRDAHAAPPTRQAIAESLTCQCGCGLTVANCNHPNCSFSVPARERIDAMLARGMGRAEIVGYFRKQYGEKILSAPTTQGFNLLAWTMPFVALLVGGGLIVLMMGRWRAGAPPTAPASDDSAAAGPGRPPAGGAGADGALRERLERELRERL